MLKAGLDPGLWTLDSGLFLPKLYPPEKTSISPPIKLPSSPPKKNLPPNKKFNFIGFFSNKQVRSVDF